MNPDNVITTAASSAALLHDLRHSIEYRDPKLLKPNPKNARKHSKRQRAQIAATIREYGFINPIITDSFGKVLAGHGRLEAALEIGLDLVPTINLGHLSKEQLRAYALADNKLAELSEWDRAILIEELGELSLVMNHIELTGFSTCEVDLLLDKSDPDKVDPADECPELKLDLPPVTKRGDIWTMGKHRLMCGDATNAQDYADLMNGQLAIIISTDAPYNLAVASLSVTKRHREFVQASGEMSPEQFTEFLKKVATLLKEHSVDGSIHYFFMDYRHLMEILTACQSVYSNIKQLAVWAKNNGGMGTFYRNQHELVLIYKNGSAPHINNFGLGETGRYRTNVWNYAGVNTFGRHRDEELAMHPTCKPVIMISDILRDCSNRNDIVLDPFMGSGTTIMAAEKTGRIAYGMDLDPHYIDVAVRRWQTYTGRDAVHGVTGQTFAETEAAAAEGDHHD
jgi:DNA modification methylase